MAEALFAEWLTCTSARHSFEHGNHRNRIQPKSEIYVSLCETTSMPPAVRVVVFPCYSASLLDSLDFDFSLVEAVPLEEFLSSPVTWGSINFVKNACFAVMVAP